MPDDAFCFFLLCTQDGIAADIAKYPTTLKVFLGVTAMGVESPQGNFVQTGAELLSLTEGPGQQGMLHTQCRRT